MSNSEVKNWPWVQYIPVISSAHAPSSSAFQDIGVLCAPYDFGWFVYLDADETTPWFVAIREAMKVHAPDDWIRVDSVGETVNGLPIFDW